MKKIFYFMLVGLLSISVILSFSLLGCKEEAITEITSEEEIIEEEVSEEVDEEEAVGEAVEAKDKFVVGYDIYWEGNVWSQQETAEFKYAIEKEYSDMIEQVYYTSSEGDIAKQLNNFDDLIVKGCDIIFIKPLTPGGLVDKIKEAVDLGIKVIVYQAETEGEDYTAYVNADEYELGKMIAEWLVEAIDYKGDVVLLNGIAGQSTCIDAGNGARSIFDQYEDINILQEVFTDWDYSKTKIATQDILQAYPNLTGIWSYDDPRPIAEAFIEGNYPWIPFNMVGENGALKIWKDNIEKGLVSRCFTKAPYGSKIALDVGMAILKGKTYEKVTVVPGHVITEEEIDDYYRPDLPEQFYVVTLLPDEEIKKLLGVE